MFERLRAPYRLLRKLPEAQVFMLNLWMHTRMGAIPISEVTKFALLVAAAVPKAILDAKNDAVTLGITPDKKIIASYLWRSLEAIAIEQVNGFLLRPLERHTIPKLSASDQVFTVLDVPALMPRYVSAATLLSMAGGIGSHGTDQSAVEAYLEKISLAGPVSLSSMWLKRAFKEMTLAQLAPKTYRTRIPGFWLRPTNIPPNTNATDLRNRLGLVHYKHDALLLEIAFSTKPFIGKTGKSRPVPKFIRPNTLGCRPGPRFRAAKAAEIAAHVSAATPASLDPHGHTINLESLAAGKLDITGEPELVSTEVSWAAYDCADPANMVAMEEALDEWWSDFEPQLRVLGRVAISPAVEKSDLDDVAFARRLRSDIQTEVIGGGFKVPAFGLV